MSTTTTGATPATDHRPPLPTVLGRAVASEWTRLWTVRSTWWALLGAAALMLLMGVAFGIDGAGDGEPVQYAGEFAIFPGQLAFLVVVLLGATAEYATGAIRSTLQGVPRRGVLLTARTAVAVTSTTALAVVLAALTDLVAWSFMGDTAVVDGGAIASSLGSVAVLVGVGGVMAAGLAHLTRSTAGALTAVFLLQMGLPMVLPAFGVEWLTTVSEHLPGYAGASLLAAMEMDLSELHIASRNAVLVAWPVAALVAGGLSLLRRDAV